MASVNHWGKWVDSEIAITGVVNNNSVEFLNDEVNFYSIDLDYEEFLKGDPDPDDIEMYESDNSSYLIGSWLKDEKGLYYPDRSGEYSAIVNDFTTQVVWSKYTQRTALCSPCYPGQGDLDSEGIYLTFCLPPDLMGYEEDNSPENQDSRSDNTDYSVL